MLPWQKLTTQHSKKAPVTFHDDGANGDKVAGDGLFTASVKSGVAGEFQVFANIKGTSSNGSPFQRTTSTSFKVNRDTAHFSSSFTTRGIDTNGDGLFEQIGVSPMMGNRSESNAPRRHQQHLVGCRRSQ